VSGHHYHLACNELVERVTDLLEGAVGEAERVRLEQHVVWCEMCADYVDQMRRANGLLEHVGASEDLLDGEDAAAIAADLLRRAAAQGGRS
jgi:predicted anti-sigma-YlaC factor YlaD